MIGRNQRVHVIVCRFFSRVHIAKGTSLSIPIANSFYDRVSSGRRRYGIAAGQIVDNALNVTADALGLFIDQFIDRGTPPQFRAHARKVLQQMRSGSLPGIQCGSRRSGVGQSRLSCCLTFGTATRDAANGFRAACASRPSAATDQPSDCLSNWTQFHFSGALRAGASRHSRQSPRNGRFGRQYHGRKRLDRFAANALCGRRGSCKPGFVGSLVGKIMGGLRPFFRMHKIRKIGFVRACVGALRHSVNRNASGVGQRTNAFCSHVRQSRKIGNTRKARSSGEPTDAASGFVVVFFRRRERFSGIRCRPRCQWFRISRRRLPWRRLGIGFRWLPRVGHCFVYCLPFDK